MKCKYCNSELAQWGGFCPVCGMSNSDVQQDAPDKKDEPQPLEIEMPKEEHQEISKTKRMAAISGCVALLAVLATVLFFGIRGQWDIFSWLIPRDNDIHFRDSYIVKDRKAIRKMDTVVATMGDEELTNAHLQIYYWSEVYAFINENSYYLSYLGLDYTKPLSEQTSYFDSTLSWEKYFLNSAIQTWQSYAAFAMLARENQFTMPQEARADLDNLEENLKKEATKGGFDSVDAMVADTFGAGVTLVDYQSYMEVYYLGYFYFESLYAEIDPTMEDIEAYFAANKETLEAQGIKQDGKYTVDVRHILVMIDNIAAEMDKQKAGEESDEEEEKFTEEHWNACFEQAQKIYQEYLNGEQTEEHFGELANKYSHDKAGQVTDGGIYTFVQEGKMVKPFNDWCFNENRRPGNTAIVKTEYGYHVMYFVGSEEIWVTQTRSALISEQTNKIVEDALKRFTPEIQYKKIVLANVEL